jgi:hypothetical protein
MQVSKKVFVGGLTAVLCLGMSVGAYADTALKKITAYKNPNISIEVDGSKLDLTSEEGDYLDPIIFEGYSYVPARFLAESLGGSVKWDNDTQKVIITSDSLGKPVNDNSKPSATPKPSATATPKPSATATPKPAASSKPSTSKGSISDPVPLGQSFTWSPVINYNPGKAETLSSTITMTINKATPITTSEIASLGFETKGDSKVEYAMVDVSLKVSNATFKKGSESDDATYLSSFKPIIWGVKTPDSAYIIGGTDYGFDTSLSTAVSNVTDGAKVREGESKSFEASGQIIMPLIKGEENYLVYRNLTNGMDYDASFMYFKLK